MTTRYRCLACGERTLLEPPPGTHEICSCGWQDDHAGSSVDERSGANGCTLREFRRDSLAQQARHAYWDAGNQHGSPEVVVHLPGGAVVSVDDGADWCGDLIDRGHRVERAISAAGRTVTIVVLEKPDI